jgi:hypothetical protein
MTYRCSNTDEYGNNIHLPARISNEDQVLISEECARYWGVRPTHPGFLGLYVALNAMLSNLSTAGNLTAILAEKESPFKMLSDGIGLFNIVSKRPNHRWAVLIDEVELAPSEVHEAIDKHIRGGATELILKVSMSPFDHYQEFFLKSGQAVEGNDYQVASLTNLSWKDLREFTERLWEQTLERSGIPKISFDKALGKTRLVCDYQVDTKHWEEDANNLLEWAYNSDRDFKEWLKRNGIENLNAWQKLPRDKKQSTLTKVRYVLHFRRAVLTSTNNGLRRRSRNKLTDVFSGSYAVIKMLEGNPRWIKMVFTDMLRHRDREKNSKITPGNQYDALYRLAVNVEALINTTPVKEQTTSARVLDIVDAVSEYFNSQLLGKFDPSPAHCFKVDGPAERTLATQLVKGLYSGIFIQKENRKRISQNRRLEGQVLRLANILSIRPNMEFLYRETTSTPISLSTILESSKKTNVSWNQEKLPI